jgi:hypothetical protein
MNALIAAAGLGTRLLDLSAKRNPVPLDLGGATLAGRLPSPIARAGISEMLIAVNPDGLSAPHGARHYRSLPRH